MKSTTKYIISGVFILFSLMLLAYSLWQSHSEPDSSIITQSATGFVNIPLTRKNIDLTDINSDKNQILPLILLEPTVCASCLNNLVDYKNLFNEHPSFNDALLVFMNHETQTVDRFLATTQLSFSYVIADSTQIPAVLKRDILQNLLFWDINFSGI